MFLSENKAQKQSDEKKKLGVWIVVCLGIFIYLVILFCTYFFGDTIDIYEVVKSKSDSSLNYQYTALALRKETVVNAESSGYISFFVGDALPVTVGENVYVLDPDGDTINKLDSSAENVNLLNEDDLNKLKNTIYDFDVFFDESDYYDAYSFKYKLLSQITDLIYSSNFNLNNSDMDNVNNGLFLGKSPCAGIVQHSYDGYEDTDVDDIEAVSFRKENYNKIIIKSNDYVENGSIAYKVITSEEWKLVFQITDNDTLADLDSVTFEFVTDGVEVTGDLETFIRAGNEYGVISLDKYMIRYISNRFVQIRIINESVEGLKIPKSSVGNEEFYKIPIEFLTEGGDSSEMGFIKKDESGSVKFVAPVIVKKDESYCYVSQDSFQKGDIIIQPETNVTYKVLASDTLPCAYIYDGGRISYRLVEVIDEFSGYYIVRDDTEYGLRVYDQILREAVND